MVALNLDHHRLSASSLFTSTFTPSLCEDSPHFTTYDPAAACCPNAMQVNVFAPFQVVLRPRNQFALFVVSYFTAKLLHLGSHAGSLPILLYLLYFPTFLLPDALLLLGSKLLIYRHNGNQPSTIRKWVGASLALVTVLSSSECCLLTRLAVSSQQDVLPPKYHFTSRQVAKSNGWQLVEFLEAAEALVCSFLGCRH